MSTETAPQTEPMRGHHSPITADLAEVQRVLIGSTWQDVDPGSLVLVTGPLEQPAGEIDMPLLEGTFLRFTYAGRQYFAPRDAVNIYVTSLEPASAWVTEADEQEAPENVPQAVAP